MNIADPHVLHVWRHPRADGAEGICVGRTDLRVDPRRARNLAHQIVRFARSRALPRIVVTSPLARTRDVGRWLSRWGWVHRVDEALCEADFGDWEGQPWTAIPRAALDAWSDDFADYRPGGGESVAGLLRRVRAFDPGRARIAVTHGGWLSAAAWLAGESGRAPASNAWPAPPPPGGRVEVVLKPAPR